MLRLVFSRRAWLTTLLVLAATAVLVRLGIWQLDRFTLSQAFNAHLEVMQAAPVLDLAENLSSLDLRQAKLLGWRHRLRSLRLRLLDL